MALSPLHVTILGSGTSHGVPVIACGCAVCHSADPRDKRTRSSIYVDDGEAPFLVDTTPEMRLQCIAHGVTRVSAALFTHAHADHIFGFDDLRRFCDLRHDRLPVYGSPATLDLLRAVYGYAFDPALDIPGYVRVTAIPFDGPFLLGSIEVTPLSVTHGRAVTHGFLFSRGGRKVLAYIPDCKTVAPEALRRLQGVGTLIIDGLRDESHPTHMTIAEAIATGASVAAGETILTHLTHHKSHADREKELPPRCRVAHDGMKLAL